MPNSMVIKWTHRLLTLVLLVLVIWFALLQSPGGPPYDDAVVSTRQLNHNTWLYITKYQGGNATVSDVYRYYLAGPLPASPLKELAKIAPFLTANTQDAVVSKIGNLLSVNVTGKIYDFTNNVFYYSNGIAQTPSVDIRASSR